MEFRKLIQKNWNYGFFPVLVGVAGSDTPTNTGKRVWLARLFACLDDIFLLIYIYKYESDISSQCCPVTNCVVSFL